MKKQIKDEAGVVKGEMLHGKTGVGDKQIRSEYSNILKFIALVAFMAAIVIFVFAMFFWGNWPSDISDFGATGDYFGGLLNPLFGFCTIGLLIWSIRIQINELILTRKAVEGQRKELVQSNAIHGEQSKLAAKQLAHSKDQLQFEQARFYDELYLHELASLRKLLNKEVFVALKDYLPDKMLPTVDNVIEELVDREFSRQALFHLRQLIIDKKYQFHKFEIQTQFQRLSATVKPYLIAETQDALGQTRFVDYLTILQKLMLVNLVSYKDVLYLEDYLCSQIKFWHEKQLAILSKDAEKGKNNSIDEYCAGNIWKTVQSIDKLKNSYETLRNEYDQLKQGFTDFADKPKLFIEVEYIIKKVNGLRSSS